MDIRPAATLVLTRDTSNGLQVLLLQRTWDAVFLPGFFVFPGGAVDDNEADSRTHTHGPNDDAISQVMSLSEGGADYMLAAVRECFEEAGILRFAILANRFDHQRIIDLAKEQSESDSILWVVMVPMVLGQLMPTNVPCPW